MTLSPYLPQDRLQAIVRGESLPERTHGTALFADISGFTPLAESLTLSLGAQRGAEELTRRLNLVYKGLVSQITRYRGSVIGFVGDAVTCWFEETAEDGRIKDEKFASDTASSFILQRQSPAIASSLRAAACALAMQSAMSAFPHLAIKIGIASGPARRFVVGDPNIQVIDTLVGETLRQMAQAQTLAEKGELVLAPSAFQALTGFVRPVRDIDSFTVINQLNAQVTPTPWDELPDDALTTEQLRPWVLPGLYERLTAGQEQFTTELRVITALFVQFEGIDFDHDETAGARLDAYIRQAQRIVKRYEGNLLQLTIGDKGSFFYAVFGAPVAHDDDPYRAVQAALELTSNFQPPTANHIGIAQGQMRVGAYGSPERRTYGAIGDAAILAARLMQAAPVGEIWCDYNVYRAVHKRIVLETLPPVRVKGKAGLVRVYQPTHGRPSAAVRHSSELIGRRAEIAAIEKLLDEVQGGKSRTLIIEGEAGIGKSRLVDELKRLARERGLTGLIGNGQSIEQQTPYRAWRDVFTSYFDFDEVTNVQERRASVESVSAQIIPEHMQRLPVLNDVLGLGIPETELTRSLDANLRQQNVILVLTAFLRAWTNEHPLLLILEDAHWLDELSWQLAVQVARELALSNAPLLFILVNRPLDEDSAGQKVFAELSGIKDTQSLALSALAPDEIVALIANRLNVPTDALPAPLVELVQARANGNPFFAEELVFNLRDTRTLEVLAVSSTAETSRVSIIGDLETAQRTLPDTLHGLILSRIDRLPPERQFVVKVAAVIGRAFAFTPLHHVVNQYVRMVDKSLREHLTSLTKADFTLLETLEPELTYLFKHIITQEAAYQTLLFSQRRELHRFVAEWYETKYEGGEIKGNGENFHPSSLILPLLAHHYRYAEDVEKEIHYLRLAGEAAEKVYANEAAIGFYTRLLSLVSPKEQIELYIHRGSIFEVIGDWDSARDDYFTVLELAGPDQTAQANAHLALGKLGHMRGEYDSALEWLSQAKAECIALNNHKGLAETLVHIATLLTIKGDYPQARVLFEENLALARELDDKRNISKALNNLGVLDSEENDNDTAQARWEEALSIDRELGDKYGIAIIFTNLASLAMYRGDHAAARALLDESLALNRELGYKWGTAGVLNNLGMAALEANDYADAQEFFSASLNLWQSLGNRVDIPDNLVGLANVALGQCLSGDLAQQQTYAYRAACLACAAKTLLEMNTAMSTDFRRIYERTVTGARERLSEKDFNAAWAQGAQMTLEQAIDKALKVTKNL